MESVVHDLFSLDNILAVIFIVFLWLQHVREKERSANFFGTVNKLIEIVETCQEKLKATER